MQLQLTEAVQTLIGVMIVPGVWQQSKAPWRWLHQDGLIQNNGGVMALSEKGCQMIAVADRVAVLNFIDQLLTRWCGSPTTSPTPPATQPSQK